MRFAVLWKPDAEAQLLDLWANHPEDREGLTEAAEEIDHLLRDDPSTEGRLFGQCRILIKPPIVALFSVDDGDRKVQVLQVKRL